MPDRTFEDLAVVGERDRGRDPWPRPWADSEAQFETAADTRNILDWIRIFNSGSAPTPYLGQTAKVTGFVYHDPRLQANQFIVSRFVITCCAADASAIGMIVTWDQSSSLKESAWIEVKGPVQSAELGGQPIPLIQAVLVQPVQQPQEPYLYP